MPLSAAERRANARRAAYLRSATSDPANMTEAKRQSFMDSFLPGGSRGGPDVPGLSEQERQRRGDAARRAYMIALSQKAALARRNGAQAPRES
jgi:hypothetical protein